MGQQIEQEGVYPPGYRRIRRLDWGPFTLLPKSSSCQVLEGIFWVFHITLAERSMPRTSSSPNSGTVGGSSARKEGAAE